MREWKAFFSSGISSSLVWSSSGTLNSDIFLSFLLLRLDFSEFDGFADVGFEGGFEFLNLCEGGEADDADGLGLFGLLDEEMFWVFEKDAFDEAEDAAVFEGADEEDVFSVEGVAGDAPFYFFGEFGGEDDFAEFLEFGLPVFVFSDVAVDFGVGFVHGVVLAKRGNFLLGLVDPDEGAAGAVVAGVVGDGEEGGAVGEGGFDGDDAVEE